MQALLPVLICTMMVLSSGCDKIASSIVHERAERRRMETVERLARDALAHKEREEATRLEREKAEAEKLKMTLPEIIEDRITLLKTQTGELTDALKEISNDRRLAGKMVFSIEDKRGLEYTVYNMMTNTELNALSVKYTGGDFGALKSEFTEAIRFHKTSRSALTQTMQKNAEEYRSQVKNVDQSVDAANQDAKRKINAAHENITRQMNKLIKERANVESGLGRRTEKDARITAIDSQLERLEQVLELSGGSVAHIKATALESSTRRKYDRALDEKQTKDAAAISENLFKGDMYNVAQNYRGRSIDRLLNAMTTQAAVLSERLCTLEEALRTLEEYKARMGMMEYVDLVKLRETIVSDTQDKLLNALTAPVGGL